jgi:hypothetical protein
VHLARAPHAYDKIRIYLCEGLIDKAVRAVGDRFGRGARDETLVRLASAAHASHPNGWSDSRCIKANSIIDGNEAGYYALAAQWLEKDALAHKLLGREEDWRARLDELIDRHKLRPLTSIVSSVHEDPFLPVQFESDLQGGRFDAFGDTEYENCTRYGHDICWVASQGTISKLHRGGDCCAEEAASADGGKARQAAKANRGQNRCGGQSHR